MGKVDQFCGFFVLVGVLDSTDKSAVLQQLDRGQGEVEEGRLAGVVALASVNMSI